MGLFKSKEQKETEHKRLVEWQAQRVFRMMEQGLAHSWSSYLNRIQYQHGSKYALEVYELAMDKVLERLENVQPCVNRDESTPVS